MSMDPLKDIQKEIADVLRADPYFANVPVICELTGDIENQIEITIAKLGVCIVVQALTGKPTGQGIGAYSLDLDVVIMLTENVTINQGATGSKKPGSEILAMILCLLNPMRQVPAWAESFVVLEAKEDGETYLGYIIRCKATAGFQLVTT